MNLTLHPLRWAAILAVCMALHLFAQQDSTTREVHGRVLGHAGQIVPGAVVQVKDLKTLQVRSFITQEDGAYHFFGLSTNSDYELSATKEEASSPVKTLRSFDSRKKAVIDLKLK